MGSGGSIALISPGRRLECRLGVVSLQVAGMMMPALQGDAPERLPLVWSCDVACTWIYRHVMSAKAT